MKTQKLMTLDMDELKIVIDGIIRGYDDAITEKIKSEVNRIIRDKTVSIFCGLCNLNILLDKEPTVFGSKGGGKSNSYHMDCWRKL